MNKITTAFLVLTSSFQIASAEVRGIVDTTNKDLNESVEMTQKEIIECPIVSKIISTIDNDENATSDKEDYQDLISEIGIDDFLAMVEYTVSVDENLSAEGFLYYIKKNNITIDNSTRYILYEELDNEKKEKKIKFELIKEYHDNLLILK